VLFRAILMRLGRQGADTLHLVVADGLAANEDVVRRTWVIGRDEGARGNQVARVTGLLDLGLAYRNSLAWRLSPA
jgi:hypothetical protein